MRIINYILIIFTAVLISCSYFHENNIETVPAFRSSSEDFVLSETGYGAVDSLDPKSLLTESFHGENKESLPRSIEKEIEFLGILILSFVAISIFLLAIWLVKKYLIRRQDN